ncbi:hypothetical protein M409DRAFT_38244 [Zasmidium cellare ATCC 36951]|uniref:PNPLA domain-containing protein n=1 Tax=Zasmidium cellare ATCC 36951 TaxID=1080233 RepID=A0A6A6BUS9_ZASCE|nr:uncharacterized protein M409DRAFT_38244 [Zasmidium cellare ATCC 36951]KAF2158445.1 hypothetical protein M409DRAFT_38244 [Zasmidium cellare ATCC 36951]
MAAHRNEEWVRRSDDPPALLDLGRLDDIAKELNDPRSQYPQIVVYCGGRSKNRALRRSHPTASRTCRSQRRPTLGRLCLDRSTRRTDTPLLILNADFSDMVTNQPLHCSDGSNDAVKAYYTLEASPTHDWAATIMHRLFFPFCDVIVLFAEDMGGLHEVSVCLQKWCSLPANSTLPTTVKLQVIVVFSRVGTAESQIEEETFTAACRHLQYSSHFAGITLRCPAELVGTLRSHLQVAKDRRRREHLMFTTHHMAWFFGRAVQHVAASLETPFDFLATSRAMRPPAVHLREALSTLMQITSLHRLSHRSTMTLVASRILLDAYQPFEHEFPPKQLFDRFYSALVLQALEDTYLPAILANTTPRAEVASALLQQVLDIATQLFERLIDQGSSSTRIQTQTLHEHAPTVGWLAPDLHRACFFCLSPAPEHIFACGHQICDCCVIRLGQQLSDAEYQYDVSCVLCRDDRTLKVTLKPPTAGVRIICLDGGGIRGLIQLDIMKKLENRLGGDLDCRDCFDLALGTSAGGLTVLGLFAEGWSLTRCRRIFEETAKSVFGAPAMFGIVPYVRYALKDGMYSSQLRREVLQRNFGPSRHLFGPAQTGTSGTKVGVTLTLADTSTGNNHGPPLCIATNYSGEGKASSEQPGYTPGLVTSAAPLYFKPVHVPPLNTCVDGGLHGINPAEIAVSEAYRLWPSAKVDAIVSIGTGRSDAPHAKRSLKWLPPSLACLAGWASTALADVLDPEKIHGNLRRRFQEGITYHRLNIDFRRLPRMDDLSCIRLIPTAVSHGLDARQLDAVVLSLLSSSFFFELDSMPSCDLLRNRYRCAGSLRIRGKGQKVLQHLERFWPSGAAFRLSGTAQRFEYPLTLGEICPQCTRFKKSIHFHVRDLDQQVQLHLVPRNVDGSNDCNGPRLVSGFPNTLRWFVARQRLDHLVSGDDLITKCMCRGHAAHVK